MLTQDSIGRDYVLGTGVVITIIACIPERNFQYAGHAYQDGINGPIYFWNDQGEFENRQFPISDIQNQVVALPFSVH